MNIAAPTVSRMRTELSAFFNWWVHELRDVGEVILARMAPRLVTRAVLHVDRTGEPVGLADCARNTRTVIVLSADQVLRQELVLPDSVEGDLDQIIALRLERELPLSRDRVCVHYSVVNRSPGERRITVRLLVARRDQIEKLRERAQGQGVRLVRVGVAQEGGRIVGNFLQGASGLTRRQLTLTDKRLLFLAAALAGVLLIEVLGQWIYERIEVGRELHDVSAVASTVSSLVNRLTREAVPAEALSALMHAPDATDVLLSLTAAVPADSWVYELQVTARPAQRAQIKLSAFSPAATTLVDVLEKMPQFENVQLESALSAGLGTAQDRLQLVAHWVDETAALPKDAGGTPLPAPRGARQ